MRFSYTLLLLIYFLAVPITDYSQNLQFIRLGGPHGGYISNAGCDSSGIVFVSSAASSGAFSFRSINKGHLWEKIFNGVLYPYLFKADSIGWASNGGCLYRTMNRGCTWQMLANLNYTSLQIFDKERNMLASDYRYIMLSTDDGMTWRTIASPSVLPEGTGSHMAVNQNNTLYVGTRLGLYCTSDYGTNWQLAGLLNYDIGFIKIDNKDIIYLRTPSTGTSATLLRSLDKGKSWKQVDSTFTKRNYSSLFCGKNNKIYLTIVGGGVYSSEDNGEHWIERNNGLADLYCRTIIQDYFGTLYVGCQYKGIFRSTDEGESWTQCQFNKTYIYAIQQGTDGSVLIASSAGGIYSTMNSGKTWQFLGLDDCLLNVFAIRSDEHMTATAHKFKSFPTADYGDQVFISTNRGRDWANTIHLPGGWTGDFVKDIVYDKYGNIFLGVSGQQVFRSRDNGFTWQNIKLEQGLKVNSLAVDDSMLYASTSNGRVYVSSDTGNHWRYYTVGTGKEIYAIKIAGKDTLVSGAQDGFYISTDKGEHWAKKNNGLLDTTIEKVVVTKNGDFYLCTSKYINYTRYVKDIYRSKNRGNSWEIIATNVSEMNITDIFIDDNGFLYIGTGGDGIYRTVFSVTEVEQGVNYYPRTFVLYQNFPNPFNSRTYIHFSIPAASDVTLKLYDILGREVTTLLDKRVDGGSHSVEWDAINVSSGMYFCRLRAGNRTSTIKVVVNK